MPTDWDDFRRLGCRRSPRIVCTPDGAITLYLMRTFDTIHDVDVPRLDDDRPLKGPPAPYVSTTRNGGNLLQPRLEAAAPARPMGG